MIPRPGPCKMKHHSGSFTCAVMLIGFAPVAWVFSQSTNSLFFMGMLHIVFWLIGLRFGSRLLRKTLSRMGAERADYLRVWTLIFLLTSLQMTTALRPIIGTADEFITHEKRFFLSHWVKTMDQDIKSNDRGSGRR